jgi:hypothetical protein
MRRPSQEGFVLLMALLIVTFVAAVAALGVAALTARQSIAGADTAAAHALAAAQQGMHAIHDTLRWHPSVAQGEEHGDAAPDGAWSATWTIQTPAPGVPPQALVALSAFSGGAHKQLRASLELRPEPLPRGLSVGGDVVLSAPLALIGTGLYGAGSLHGREWLSFTPGTLGAQAPDYVQSQLWAMAGAHVAQEIWASDREIHSGGGEATWAADTDVHTGELQVARLCAAPSSSLLSALEEHSSNPGSALQGESIDLARLPVPPLDNNEREGARRLIITLEPPAAPPLSISGQLSPAVDDLVLVIQGDASLGAPDQQLTITRGMLVVTGHLTVAGPAQHTGHVYAGTLTVAAPWQIAIAQAWRSVPLPGLTAPTLLTVTEGAP